MTLTVRKPGASTDALKLLGSGRADLAVLDIHDLGLARQQGEDVVGVMALVQKPLAAVLAQPDVRSPADLEGRRAGVTASRPTTPCCGPWSPAPAATPTRST